MGINIRYNKKKDILSINYTSLKHFNFNLLNEIILIDELMIFSNLEGYKHAKCIESHTVDQIVKRLSNDKNTWNIVLMNLHKEELNEEKLIDHLLSNKISILIDIDLSENEIQVLINLKKYGYDIVSKIREKLEI